MRIPSKEREVLSKQRQSLRKSLEFWQEREKIATLKREPNVAFCRQEQAKVQKALRDLDKGFTRQRAWSQGKFKLLM